MQVGTMRRAFARDSDWGHSTSAHRQHFAAEAMEQIVADFGLETGSQGESPRTQVLGNWLIGLGLASHIFCLTSR